MLTIAAHSEPRLVLIKSAPGGFANKPGYYLHNGRWHAVAKHGPAPKGAPQAAHPHAAGQHKPVTLTPEQVEQLKYPADKAANNSEMAAFNEKHLPSLLAHAADGDATAILGHGFGTNTHAKKKVAIANFLLSQMGSKHQVQAGQGAGEHAAVKQEPAVPQPVASAPEQPAPAPPQPEPAASTQAAPAPTTLTAPEFQEGKKTQGVKAYYDKKAAAIIAMAQAGDVAGLKAMPNDKGNSWAGKTPNSKKLLELHAAALSQAEDVLLQDVTTPPATPAPAPKSLRLVLPKAPPAVSQPKPEAAPASQAAAITPQSGMPDWDAAMLPDTNSNAKSHNGIVGKIKAMAEAGDVDGLMAVIDAKHGAKQTYAKKQLALAQAAMGALQSAAPVNAPTPAAPEPSSGDQAAVDPLKKLKDDLGFAVSTSQATKIASAYVVAHGHTSSAYSEASKLLSANGYAATAKTFAEASETAKQNEQNDAAGPKDGDTKPGADGGTLVFKDGRWHKQKEPELPESIKDALNSAAAKGQVDFLENIATHNSSEQVKAYAKKLLERLKGTQKVVEEPPPKVKALKPSEAIKVMASVGAKTAPGNKEKFKAMAVAGDVAGLQQFVAENSHKWPASTKVAKKLIAAMTSGDGVALPPIPSPAAAPAPAPTSSGPPSMDAWIQTGPQGGSNPGGRFKDESGQEWYCKFPSDPEAAKSEVLAARLYAAAGLASQDAMLVTKGGKIGIASKWVSVSNAGGPAILSKVDGAQSGFAVDAWLANWDVVGLGYDNLQMGPDGKAVRIDAGGSLEYRAQGSKKPFGPKVDEIDSLRDKSKNPQAAAVFGGMTDADITASAAKVAAITPAQIRALVADHGPGDQAAKKALADTLIARREDLLARFPKADKKTAKKRLDPTALPVDPSVLPKPHDFNNWSGTGKPLSSKQHLNDANLNVEHEMLAMAKQGNLPKLQAFEFQVIDKDTGLPTGTTKPISQHPSKHVVQFHSDLVQTLDEIANPPQPLKIFRETDVGSLAALDAAFPPKPFGTTVSKVSSTEKLGFWVALGAVSMDAVNKLKPQKTSDYSSSAIAAAKAKFAGASALAKHFIHRIQQSGSYNDLFRNGKEYDNDGNKLSDVAKAALAHATEMPEGTTLYRYQKMTPAMIDHIMSAKDGTVFQATGPMCTSYHPTATSGFGSNRVVIRYAKGAKAVESFASGGYAGEKEVTTLPNARFVILSKTKKPGGNLDLELLMLPPDIGL